VLALGVILSVVVVASPDRVYPWLGLASGIMLAGIGVTLLRNGLVARRASLGQLTETALSATAEPSAVDSVGSVAVGGTRPMISTYARRQRSSGLGGIPGKNATLTLTPGIDATVEGPGQAPAHPPVHGGAGHSHDGHTHDGHTHDGHTHDGHTHDGHTHDGHTHDGHTHQHAGIEGMHSHGLFSHTHLPPAGSERTGARSMLAVGFAGGLVPSPSALVVLLGGIALGRA